MTIFEHISKTITLGRKARLLRLFYIYGFVAVIGALLPIIGLFAIIIYSYITSKLTLPSTSLFLMPSLIMAWWWFVIEVPKRRREKEEERKRRSTSSM